MKKIILMTLVFSFCTFQICSQSSKRYPKKDEHITVDRRLKKNYKEKKYGDEYEHGSSIRSGISSEYYEIRHDGNYFDIKDDIEICNDRIANVWNSNISTYSLNPDQNENNNSFEKASVVYDVTSRDIGCYGLYIGWWANIHDNNDLDYYSYDVFMNGEMTIDLSNIPEGCDYDLDFYRMGNSLTSTCNDAELVASSSFGGNSDEQIKINVTPGTYYAKVKSYRGMSEESYHIEFTLLDSRTYEEGHYSISEHKKKGDVAALWISDFRPCSVQLNFMGVKNTNVEIKNYSKYPMINHLANKYGSDKDIEYRCLYVWDKNTRIFIRDYCNIIWEYLDKTYTNGDPELNDLIVELNTTSMALSVAGLVIGLIPGGTLVGAALSVFAIVNSWCAMDGDAKNVAFRGKVSDIKNYLLAIVHEMNISESTNDSNEVVVMRTCYRFEKKKEGILWWESTRHFIDCSQKYRPSQISDYIYDNDVIDFYHKGSPINGSIVGISSKTQLEGVIK